MARESGIGTEKRKVGPDHAGDPALLAATSANGARANGSSHASPYAPHPRSTAVGPCPARGNPSLADAVDRVPGCAVPAVSRGDPVTLLPLWRRRFLLRLRSVDVVPSEPLDMTHLTC